MKYEITLSKGELKKMLTMLTIADVVANGYKAEKKRDVTYGWLIQKVLKQAVEKGAKFKLEHNELKDNYIIHDKLILAELLMKIEDYDIAVFYKTIVKLLTEQELQNRYKGDIDKIIVKHENEYNEIFEKYRVEIQKNGLCNIKMEYVKKG